MMRTWWPAALAGVAILASACDSGNSEKQGKQQASEGEDVLVQVDGSSTVFPITEAVAEEFQTDNRGMRVTVGVSGTGGGFSKFCRGETHVSDASRPIAPPEVEKCDENGIAYLELPIAYDGIAVVVNPKNDWVDDITVAELKTMWEPEAQGQIKKWSQVRDGWPEKELHLFGPGVDSGTYDYFTEAIVGEDGASRGDFTSSEDDNVLVQGVSTDKLALGFFGYAYYEENKDRLKLIPVDDENPDNTKVPVAPSPKTIANSTYQPLSRPLFIYVAKDALEQSSVRQFVHYYLDHADELAREVGYVALPDKAYELAHERVKQRVTGSAFAGKGAQVGISVQEVLSRGLDAAGAAKESQGDTTSTDGGGNPEGEQKSKGEGEPEGESEAKGEGKPEGKPKDKGEAKGEGKPEGDTKSK